MKVDIHMPLFIGDYLRDTTDLTTEEHGAYLLILMALWTSRAPLSASRLSVVARVPADRWPAVWETLARFFVEADGGRVSQLRLMRELESAVSRRESATKNGLRGGRPPNQTETGATTGHEPEPNPQKTSSSSSSSSDSSSTPASDRDGTDETIETPGMPPHEWLRRFKVAWERAVRGGGAFYGDTGDTKACLTLAAELERLPRAVRLTAEADAHRMFSAFFASDDKRARARKFPFSFFVQEFGSLRAAPAAIPQGKNPSAAIEAAVTATDKALERLKVDESKRPTREQLEEMRKGARGIVAELAEAKDAKAVVG